MPTLRYPYNKIQAGRYRFLRSFAKKNAAKALSKSYPSILRKTSLQNQRSVNREHRDHKQEAPPTCAAPCRPQCTLTNLLLVELLRFS